VNVLVLQQQAAGPAVEPPVPDGTPWQFWSADIICRITQSPLANVQQNWPLVHAALAEQGMADRPVLIAALGTVSIESASTFEPVREAFWMSEEWRQANLRYYPWYGRGYLQLTWEDSYRHYGEEIGVDLVGNPDLALDPNISARVLAAYFAERGVADAARQGDWAEVRRRVQGGYAGLDRLLSIVAALGG
jgi:hypothetical protein